MNEVSSFTLFSSSLLLTSRQQLGLLDDLESDCFVVLVIYLVVHLSIPD